MDWKREHNANWNRRRGSDNEWERAKRDIRAVLLFVGVSFILGMFIKNVGPIAVLGEILRGFLKSWGVGQ